MNDATKAMVLNWLATEHGDTEKLARWMAYELKLAGIKVCRRLIAEATK